MGSWVWQIPPPPPHFDPCAPCHLVLSVTGHLVVKCVSCFSQEPNQYGSLSCTCMRYCLAVHSFVACPDPALGRGRTGQKPTGGGCPPPLSGRCSTPSHNSIPGVPIFRRFLKCHGEWVGEWGSTPPTLTPSGQLWGRTLGIGNLAGRGWHVPHRAVFMCGGGWGATDRRAPFAPKVVVPG